MTSERFDHAKIEQGVGLILDGIGEDPERPGLRETPSRVARMYEEIFAGIDVDAANVVTVVEGADFDEMIMVRNIPLYSVCEHHLLPFVGKAHVAYIPNKSQQITGLSKVARVVDILAKKAQVQERLTTEIAEAIERALSPREEAGIAHRDLRRARAVPHRRPDPPGGDGSHPDALSRVSRT